MGPSAYGTAGEPSSSLRCSRAEAADGFAEDGREMMDGLRMRSTRGGSGWSELTALWGSEGMVREFVDDWADERVSESFFMFLSDLGGCGFAGKGEVKSDSEVAEESAEAELSPRASAIGGV